LGAWPVETGVQFSIFSRNATRVWLLLFDDEHAVGPAYEVELDPAVNRIGDIWHIHVPDARPGQYYVYRMSGDHRTRGGRRYDAGQWLLDPYGLAVAGRRTWGDVGSLVAGESPKSGSACLKSMIVADDFDWKGDAMPCTPWTDTVIYETHVRGFTAHANSGVSAPGTYRGFMEKIPYLRELGITAVEILPIHQFNEMEFLIANDLRSDLLNYWGYSTVAFFAPHAGYAQGAEPGSEIREFKELVRALHAEGIELILDVVYNHTAESGQGFRGIDPTIYYQLGPDGSTDQNYSGCGNTLNCNHPVVAGLILDSLRYWVREMHIDGFRFDLASVLTRGQNGAILANPPLIEAISEDPLLRDTKLIAEAWDAGGVYQVGSFPGARWSEWNGVYRDEVRRFWRGDGDMLGTFARRITGSADLYQEMGGTPQKSINFITCHDGFTLHDLVSYNQKHNQDNGEESRDGNDHNFSENFGSEGPSDDPAIIAPRSKQIKNFIATLFLSQGVPMLLAGDECGNTQTGNNNAYCQDNELSWLNWDAAKSWGELSEFTRGAIALRRRFSQLRQTRYHDDHEGKKETPGIQWFGPDGHPPDWNHGKAVAILLDPLPSESGTLLILCNAGDQDAEFSLPAPPGSPWEIALSTEPESPTGEIVAGDIRAGERSILVLMSETASENG
jgi:glycogen operon protein